MQIIALINQKGRVGKATQKRLYKYYKLFILKKGESVYSANN